MVERITGLILAGGLGSRVGRADKGLIALGSRPLVAHVIARFAPQVDRLLLSANRNVDAYRALGCEVVEDAVAGFAGPLAGLERGLAVATSERVAVVPCDSPFLPRDLVARLANAASGARADIAVVRAAGRRQPVFCLCRRELHGRLVRYLESGGRKMDGWYDGLAVVEVAFEEADAFRNINTWDELRAAAANAPDDDTKDAKRF